MSSPNTSYVGVKMLCVMFIISLMGTRCAVNGGVVIPGHLVSGNRPPYLVSAATGIHSAVQSGQITPAQGHQQAQHLIQMNKDKVNLALINGIGR